MKNNKLRKILLGCVVAVIFTIGVNANTFTVKATEPPMAVAPFTVQVLVTEPPMGIVAPTEPTTPVVTPDVTESPMG